jgi:ubiquinone/menaquinone biosynthesis C-methylase UbiE
MFNYLLTILTSKNPRFFFHKLLLTIIIIAIVYYLYRLSEPPKKIPEGFTQNAPFILKTDLEIYDDFYAEVYDGITERDKYCQKELFEILKMTELDTKYSTILDIGSGTGCAVNQLNNAGYNVYGIDNSKSMIEFSKTKFPEANFIKGDIIDTMTFEKGLFTHILSTNFTIYEIQDKKTFFSNCYFWLKPNGYLILHLVDREKFSAKKFEDTLMDLTAFYRKYNPPKEKRTETSAEFIDFDYTANYEIKTNSSTIVLKETFVDKQTNNIRQNENTLIMENIDDILRIASNSGFVIHAKTNMKSCNGDENQFIYVFERTL